MAMLAAAAPYIFAATAAATVVNNLETGYQNKADAQTMAMQNDQNAGQVQAASQRKAADQERQTRLVMSRAQALAGASGGGASDPTITDIIGNIAKEGEYRSMLDLYEGNDQARAIKNRSTQLRNQGEQAVSAGYYKAGATVLNSAASLYGKYGGGGPQYGAGGNSAQINTEWQSNDYGGGR